MTTNVGHSRLALLPHHESGSNSSRPSSRRAAVEIRDAFTRKSEALVPRATRCARSLTGHRPACVFSERRVGQEALLPARTGESVGIGQCGRQRDARRCTLDEGKGDIARRSLDFFSL